MLTVFLSSSIVSEKTQNMFCKSTIDCEIYVQSGAFWSYWSDYASLCNCYNGTQNDGQWAPDFPPQCATCVCDFAFNNTLGDLSNNQVSCFSNPALYYSWYGVIGIIFGLGVVFLLVSLASLNKNALAGKREIKVGRIGIIKEKASVNLSTGDALDNGDVSLFITK